MPPLATNDGGQDPLHRVARQIREDLDRIRVGWQAAWAVDLDVGPRGMDYDRGSRGRAQAVPAEGSVVRLARSGELVVSHLSMDYQASVWDIQLAAQQCQRLSWVSRVGVGWPAARDSHVPLGVAISMVDVVDQAVAPAMVGDGVGIADGVHVRLVAERVGSALRCLPGDLVDSEVVRKACPGAALWPCTSAGGVPRLIPVGWVRCGTCGRAAEWLRDVSTRPSRPKGELCLNPWRRPECRGTVEVEKHGLCGSCDQSRRNARRAS